MKNLFVVFSIILISFSSCKKKETIEPVTAAASPVVVSAYGTLQTTLLQNYTGNVFNSKDSIASAFFFSSPAGFGINTPVNAGSVSFNGVRLQNSTNIYQDSTLTLNLHQANSVWAVSGNASVSAINYTYTPSYPKFTGNANLPDSISLSSGVTVNIVGATNYQNITISIFDGVNQVYKPVPVGQTSFTFTAADLSTLSTTFSAYITVSFTNSSLQTFGGKSYSFISLLDHNKFNLKLKP